MPNDTPVGGGLKKILYTLSTARRIGLRASGKALTSRNTCKACGLGMGGQRGGMTNELGEFPSVCNKSVQAQSTDNQSAIPLDVFKYPIAQLQSLTGHEVEHLGRLNTPLYKAPHGLHFEPISWNRAMGLCVDKLAKCPAERSFFYASGRSSNEAGYLLQLLARAKGTNNVNNCSYFCHQATGVALQNTIGTATATVQLADLQHADLIFVIGANPASNHPRLLHALKACRDRGGEVVIINPVKEPGLVRFALPKSPSSLIAGGHEIASLYLQPKVGSDAWVFAGIAKLLLEQGLQDRAYIAAHCEDFDVFQKSIATLTWPDILLHTGLTQAEFEAVTARYTTAQAAVFTWGMGLTHHINGVDTLEALTGLALLRGMVGKPGAGLLPLRGHSNVQGMGTVGVKPQLASHVIDAMAQELGIPSPSDVGLDTMACLKAAHEGAIDFALMLGGNLLEAAPDTQWSKAALDRIGFKLYLTTTLNRGHLHSADHSSCLILPVAARDEEWQATTQESMFSYVRMSDGGIHRMSNVHSEVAILSELAATALPDFRKIFEEFSNHAAIRQAMSRTLTEMAPLKTLDETREEFHIAGRHLHTPHFNTPTGKAYFKPLKPIGQANSEQFPLRLISARSEGQFNTIVYEQKDSYRGVMNRQTVLMHPDDMADLDLCAGDCVELRSAAGHLSGFQVQPFNIKRGAVLGYYPETNPLIGREVDPKSQTPAYKSAPVAIKKKPTQ
ncbi:FdhF/YdeP family oxidoreductase [Simiduia aestuariiviva]|uniref:Molybdopterin-dependent oxidoreductase alpha subunit n=1 Tax=Simiduia aestuariiviva TaxID=1510459 RepID=A0A839UQU7_9GAMM|nr:FdhF/YdeP family oxidoreductase [Simiduia aestuariiviva]MBB3167787.1 molybdopterin-dependent oxidoreductase alpha subunit [Simiduia aestuariiviva]